MEFLYKIKAMSWIGITKIILCLRDITAPARTRISDTKSQRILILVIVCIALLLDNMLYMVIVPIITEYFKPKNETVIRFFNQSMKEPKEFSTNDYPANEDALTGILFASKAIVQLMANPFTGTFIDRVGYVIPLTLGLLVMFTSTTLFAFAETYGLLFAARSMQGLGSALADTAALGLIADRFHDEKERSKAVGIALAFISFGSLVAPPFGGFLCEYVGREWPFLILAFVCMVDACLLLFVQIPASDENKAKDGNVPIGTPIYKLFLDPYIAVIAFALTLANFPLAFLEPTIAKWMETTMHADKFEVGLVWLPAFIPHVAGVFVTVILTKKYFRYQWLYGAVGLVLIGVSTAAVPTCKTYSLLMIPLAVLCFGIALIDTALLPTLAFLVDVRHTSVYGSVYAIADISYSIAYALGPILAGQTVQILGYLKMNVGIGVVNIMFSPVLLFLREVYDWKPDKSERVTLLDNETESQSSKRHRSNGEISSKEINKLQYKNHTDSHLQENENSSTSNESTYLSSQSLIDGSFVNKLTSEYSKVRGFSQKSSETKTAYTTTSIKPRPRPRASLTGRNNKSSDQTAVEENLSFETTSFQEFPQLSNGVTGSKLNSVKSSMSRQELRAIAESGSEFFNPLFQTNSNTQKTPTDE